MKLLSQKYGFHLLALFLCAFLFSGCSSSGSSSSDNSHRVNDVEIGEEDITTVGDDTSVADDTESSLNDVSPSDSTVEEPTAVVADPMVRIRTQVDFEITVPAYQSDALQVSLAWGETKANAAWVGDEQWSLSLELPSDTENLLTITFSDDNGNIELGSFEQLYGTGFNDAEVFQVTAEQFNTDRWDTDDDGTSNIDELLNGSDPLVDEDSVLPIQDLTPSLFFPTQLYESYLTEERPLFITFAPHPNDPNQDSLSGNLDIDADGNGVLIRNYRLGAQYRNYSGTRTRIENSVSWDGLSKSYDGADYVTTTTFASTVTYVDGNTFEYVEDFDSSSVGTYQFSRKGSSAWKGKLIDGTSVCEPISGTYVSTRFDGVRRTRIETIVRKEIDDQYWRVVENTDFIDIESGMETNEYFAREFRLFSAFNQDEIGFRCDFVDF